MLNCDLQNKDVFKLQFKQLTLWEGLIHFDFKGQQLFRTYFLQARN